MRSIAYRILLFISLYSPAAFTQPVADSTSRQVDVLFSKWASQQAPGCAVGIVRGAQLVYAKGFGLANLEHKLPITPNSIFYMCSVSKQFTGYAIALLVQAGKIKLTEGCWTLSALVSRLRSFHNGSAFTESYQWPAGRYLIGRVLRPQSGRGTHPGTVPPNAQTTAHP